LETFGADPILQIRDLSFAYPDGRQALTGLTLAIQPGEKVAVVGPNGAGKSTLFLHLNGTLRSRMNGQIQVAGLPVNDKTVRAVRGKVGLVFQDPDDQLFSTTVFEDVAFGPLHMGLAEGEVRERVARAGGGGYDRPRGAHAPPPEPGRAQTGGHCHGAGHGRRDPGPG
jgi:cobalt/nickel transport system ATP-binding protein